MIIIRIADEKDAENLLEIYRYYVEHTAITFEYDVPTLSEFKSRINNTLKKYPYLVSEIDGEIVGYAYASSFHQRKAYQWAVETTVYIHKNKHKMGLGKELYIALESVLSLQNIINLNACIAYPDKDDEFLTSNSVEYHKHLGYRFVGEFYKCGYKFNRWYNMVYMEKHIGEHPAIPLPVKLFSDVKEDLLALYNIS